MLSADVFTGVVDELASHFERTTGHEVTIIYATAGTIPSRVQNGDAGDLTLVPRPMLEDLLRQGRITEGSIVDVARSAVGIAVRRGAPKPDISSVEAFGRSLALLCQVDSRFARAARSKDLYFFHRSYTLRV